VLLTGHWPLKATDAELAGLPRAPRDEQQHVVPPTALRPGLSVEVSALVMGALGESEPSGRLDTATVVHRTIDRLLEESAEDLLPTPDDGAPPEPDTMWLAEHEQRPADRERAGRRRRRLSVGMAGLGLCACAALGYAGFQVAGMLGLSVSTPPPHIVVDDPAPAPAPVGARVPDGPDPSAGTTRTVGADHPLPDDPGRPAVWPRQHPIHAMPVRLPG
jgi:hypothetical protein